MVEEPDRVMGVVSKHYANIAKDQSLHFTDSVLANSREFAVIAFWDLDSTDECFKCSRFFIVPNPMKRTVKNCLGTKLEQVLYSSPHSSL